MGKITEDVSEGFGHFSTHVEVGVLVLEEIDGMLDGAIGGQILDDFSVDEEEDLNFVLRKV